MLYIYIYIEYMYIYIYIHDYNMCICITSKHVLVHGKRRIEHSKTCNPIGVATPDDNAKQSREINTVTLNLSQNSIDQL